MVLGRKGFLGRAHIPCARINRALRFSEQTSPRPPALPEVVSALGDAQGFAQLAQVKLVPHDLNQGIPLCGLSESMLMAFFRVSR